MGIPYDKRVHGLVKGVRRQWLFIVGIHGAGPSGDVSALDQLDDAELLAVVMRSFWGRLAVLSGYGGNPDLMDIHQPRVGEAVGFDRKLSKHQPDELVEVYVADRLWPEWGKAAAESARIGVDVKRLKVRVWRQREEFVAARIEGKQCEASKSKARPVAKIVILFKVVPFLEEKLLRSHEVTRYSVARSINLSEVPLL